MHLPGKKIQKRVRETQTMTGEISWKALVHVRGSAWQSRYFSLSEPIHRCKVFSSYLASTPVPKGVHFGIGVQDKAHLQFLLSPGPLLNWSLCKLLRIIRGVTHKTLLNIFKSMFPRQHWSPTATLLSNDLIGISNVLKPYYSESIMQIKFFTLLENVSSEPHTKL